MASTPGSSVSLGGGAIGGGATRRLKGPAGTVLTIVAVSMSVYHILYVGEILSRLGIYITGIPHRAITLSFLIALTLLLYPAAKGGRRDRIPWYDIALIVVGVVPVLYNVFFWEQNCNRYALWDFYLFEEIFTFIVILIVLEISRRVIGLAMPLITAFFLFHMFFAKYFPGFLYTRGATVTRATDILLYSTQGIYGVALAVASTVIIMFVIFGAFLFLTPAGPFFLNISIALFGHVRGGPAKVAVVASALFGTLSGSPSANVAVTGSFTIPMMKSIGYKPSFAGAVEAVASSGGNIMPPIMGVVAFVMAEWLGISYWEVCIAAFLPALLYYLATFLVVDGEAVRLGLKGMPRSQCPSVKKTLKEGWTAIIPLVVLVYFLAVLHWSAQYAVLVALVVLIIIHMARKQTRFGLRAFLSGLRSGATGILAAGNACACAGLIIGALAVTQLGIKFSEAAVILSAGNMFLLLLFAGIAAYLLGMGMAGLPAYVMVVLFVAPALHKMGVSPLAAHLFVFYWIVIHFFTPPVCTAVYVACGISGANPWTTGFDAMRLAIATYIVPFMFVYNESLILKGTPLELVAALVTSIIGIAFVAWFAAGYGPIGKKGANWLQRLLLLGAGIALLFQTLTSNLVGLAVGGATLVWVLGLGRQWWLSGSRKKMITG